MTARRAATMITTFALALGLVAGVVGAQPAGTLLVGLVAEPDRKSVV